MNLRRLRYRATNCLRRILRPVLAYPRNPVVAFVIGQRNLCRNQVYHRRRRRRAGKVISFLIRRIGPPSVFAGFAHSWRTPTPGGVLVTHFFREPSEVPKAVNRLKIYFGGGKRTKCFELDDPRDVKLALKILRGMVD